jgi:hypothetical protein
MFWHAAAPSASADVMLLDVPVPELFEHPSSARTDLIPLAGECRHRISGLQVSTGQLGGLLIRTAADYLVLLVCAHLLHLAPELLQPLVPLAGGLQKIDSPRSRQAGDSRRAFGGGKDQYKCA